MNLKFSILADYNIDLHPDKKKYILLNRAQKETEFSSLKNHKNINQSSLKNSIAKQEKNQRNNFFTVGSLKLQNGKTIGKTQFMFNLHNYALCIVQCTVYTGHRPMPLKKYFQDTTICFIKTSTRKVVSQSTNLTVNLAAFSLLNTLFKLQSNFLAVPQSSGFWSVVNLNKSFKVVYIVHRCLQGISVGLSDHNSETP